MQGRGVMLDFERHFSRSQQLVGYDDLMRIMEIDRVGFEPGDELCLHTGFSTMLLEMHHHRRWRHLHNACAALDGADERLLQ